MTKTLRIVSIIVAVGIAFGLGFWLGDNQNKNSISALSEPIKIGVFTPLTGDGASYGNAMKNGLDLALADINKNGGLLGRKVELVYEDTHLDINEAVKAMNKFIYIDKLSIVIAAEGSGPTSSVAPLADSTRTIMVVALASTPMLKEAGDYVFRVIPSDDYQGKEIAKLAIELGHKKAGVLYVNDAYGVGIKDVFLEEFSKVGMISAVESFGPGSADFKSQLAKIKNADPGVLVIVARKEFSIILKQIKELDLKAQIIASETLKDEAIIKASGDAAEDVLLVYYAEPIDYIDFKSRFQARYNVEPAFYAEFGYDALGVLAEAIKEAGVMKTQDIKNALYDVEYQGATGMIKFDANGEVAEKPFDVFQVKDGQFVPYEK